MFDERKKSGEFSTAQKNRTKNHRKVERDFQKKKNGKKGKMLSKRAS